MQKKSQNKKSNETRQMWQGDFLFEQYPDAILIVNENGHIEDVNQQLLKMFGYEKSEVLNKAMEILMPKKYRAKHVGQRHHHMVAHKGRQIGSGIEFEAVRKDGSTFPLDIMLAPMETKDGTMTVTVIRDISEKKKAQERERDAKEILNAALNSAPVAIYSLEPNENVLSWSYAAEKLFGYSAKEVVGKPYKLIPEQAGKKQECLALLDQVFEGKTIHNMHRKRLHKDGFLVDVSISAAPMYDKAGKLYAATYAAEDISERLYHQEKLNRLAYFDEITGLPNKSHLQKDIEEQLKSKQKNALAIAAIDLGGMSEINNTLGQSSGDKVFQKIANRLTKIAKDKAIIYRTCGSEIFVKILINDDPCIVTNILDLILKELDTPFKVDNQIAHIKANAGIAIAPMHGDNIEDIFANTHLALNAAKNDTTRNYHLFEMSLREEALDKRTLNQELRDAFKNDEFEVFYQPQVRLSNNKLIGAEALLRWRHPERGLVQPSEFIDVLAKKAIAKDVGIWVMKTAAKQAMKWRKKDFPDFRIGVNLFEAQFDPATIENDVEEVLNETGLPHEALEIEITENISHGSDDEIIEPLSNLREKGVHIAFDDFGTGYASLSYLVKYPLTRIKIDKSFLENIPHSEEDSAIVHSTILMAHALGLEVIAEGVENHEHILFLNAQKCEEVQGYYHSKPLPEKEFLKYAKSFSKKNKTKKPKVKNKKMPKEKIAS